MFYKNLKSHLRPFALVHNMLIFIFIFILKKFFMWTEVILA